MRVFKVPFDVKREEKVFGGYLSLRQVLYLMFATASLLILGIEIPFSIRITFIILICGFFLLCAFFRIDEQDFDKFFFYAVKYLFRKKQFYL